MLMFITYLIYTLLALSFFSHLSLNKFRRDFFLFSLYFLQFVIRLPILFVRLCVFLFFFLNGGKEAKGFHLVSFRTVKFHHCFCFNITHYDEERRRNV